MAKRFKKQPLGVIIYEGPSELDGAPIVVIANTFKGTENLKVGDMVQTWIMRADMHPSDAKRGGFDASICGDCVHRPKQSSDDQDHMGTCYVNMMRGPISAWNTYKELVDGTSTTGSYVYYEPEYLDMFRVKPLRIGSYGDPGCVPYFIWEKFTSVSKGHTAYSHIWDNPKVDSRLKHLCMASVDSEYGKELAELQGNRTFRVLGDDEPDYEVKEIPCPATDDGGYKSQCSSCRLCAGTSLRVPTTIGVRFHGSKANIKRYNAGIEYIRAKEKQKLEDYKLMMV